MGTEKQEKARRKNVLRLIIKVAIKNSGNRRDHNISKRDVYLWKIIHAAASALIAENQGENEIWKTGNGSLISIKDMETDHVENCNRFISRNGLLNSEAQLKFFWKFMFSGELIKRGKGNEDSYI